MCFTNQKMFPSSAGLPVCHRYTLPDHSDARPGYPAKCIDGELAESRLRPLFVHPSPASHDIAGQSYQPLPFHRIYLLLEEHSASTDSSS